MSNNLWLSQHTTLTIPGTKLLKRVCVWVCVCGGGGGGKSCCKANSQSNRKGKFWCPVAIKTQNNNNNYNNRLTAFDPGQPG